MALSLTNPIVALNIMELILAIIISGLVGGLGCPGNVVELQYVAAIVYGYLMINCITVAAIFVNEVLDKSLRFAIAAAGAVLWLAASALLLQSSDTGACQWGEAYDRAVAGGVLGLAKVIALVVDAFFVFKSG